MKKSMYNRKNILHWMLHSEKFKIFFFGIVVLAFYGAVILGTGTYNFFESTLIPFQFSIFNILFFSFFSLSTIYYSSLFNKKFDYYIIRLKTKKNHLKELIINITLVNLYLIALFIILFFSFKLLFSNTNFNIAPFDWMYENIPNITYLLFYTTRYFILLFIFQAINILLFYHFNSKVSYIYTICFLIGLAVDFVPFHAITSFQINPWLYFSVVEYANFHLEVTYSLSFVLLTSILLFIGYNYKVLKAFLLSFKYYCINDWYYFIKKRKIVLLLAIVVPIGSTLLSLSSYDNCSELFKSITAFDFHLKESSILSTLLYIFHISVSVFLIIDLYAKDLKYQLDNIFLREKAGIWFIKKMLLFFTFFILFKLTIYIVITIICMNFFEFSSIRMSFYIFWYDILYAIFCQVFAITYYTVFNSLKKMRIIYVLFGLLGFLLIPRNAYALSNKFILNSILLVILFGISYFNFICNRKVFIQKVGGV